MKEEGIEENYITAFYILNMCLFVSIKKTILKIEIHKLNHSLCILQSETGQWL